MKLWQKDTLTHKKSLSLVSKDAQNSINETFKSFSNRIILPHVAGRQDLQSELFKKLFLCFRFRPPSVVISFLFSGTIQIN